jgi:uncharacterized membrane protein YdjX (TVP38/TMEM64 family)
MNRAVKIAVLIAWATIFLIVLFGEGFRERLLALVGSGGIAAGAFLIAVQIALTVLLLPSSPVTVLFGIVWGPWTGLAFSITSTLLCSSSTYLLGLRFFPRFEHRIGGATLVLKVGEKLRDRATLGSLLVHANPLLPASSLGYVFGHLKVPFGRFILGAALGTIPVQLALVHGGALLAKLVGKG